MQQMDWAQVQAFLAVAETGSLSAAARKLDVSQPTLGRHVRALEEDLQVELFRRRPKGLSLTELGARMLPAAQRMRDAASEITLTAAGTSTELDGTVRITASESVAFTMLPEVVAGLRVEEPGIQLEVVASDAANNLMYREADIALRMYRPEQPDLVTKHLGNVAIGFFAAKSYLDRTGRPSSVEEAFTHDLVGHDTDERILKGARERGLPITRESFAIRCDNISVYWQLICGGCGLGFGLVAAAERDPRLERILPEVPIETLPMWLTAHGSLRYVPRIRRVWDHLAQALPPILR